MLLFWAEETKDDFRRFDDFLHQDNPQAAINAAKTIRQKALILSDHPKFGILLNEKTGIRQLVIPFGKAAYILRYFPDYEILCVPFDIVRVERGSLW